MKLYGDAKKHCQTRGECVLCKTHFNAAQTSEFIASMESAIQNLKKFEAIKSRLEANEAYLLKMRKYLDDAVKYVKMDVKAFDNEISTKQHQLDAANKKVNDATKSLKNLEITRNTLRKLADTILELNRIKDELQDKSREIERLNDDVQTQSLMAGTSATPDELEEEQTTINKKVKSSRSKLDNLNKAKELELHKITKAENNIKDLKLSISNMEMKSASKINIENSIKELTQEIEKQSDSLRETKKQLYNADAELKNKMSEYSRFKQESDEIKSKLQKEVDEMGVVKFKLARLDQEIADFVKSGGEAQFETVKETSKSLQDQINGIEAQISDLNTQLKQIETELNNQDNEERIIRYNLDMIDLVQEQNETKSEIAKLDLQQAQSERDRYLEKSKELQQRQMDMQAEYSSKIGQVTQLRKQIEQINMELTRDYDQIDHRYTKEYAKLQTKLAMVTDLTTCFKATDNGVMKFHQYKMKQINRTIDELWKKTYMGNDIETIQIRADQSTTKKADSTTRSYNYRVVMVKNGIKFG
ncbi:unnamed protein product [Ambrosiozyma monospora]|uniref:Unnamed protein product n=1 Tax=Ambrosiozyma monospora TaxID=43982 RepID=A0A9W6Z580_AMBMO|nr:unnamed protein product [Ambrosiozyma monospora]